MNNTNKLIIVAVASLVVGLILGFLIWGGAGSASSGRGGDGGKIETNKTVGGSDSAGSNGDANFSSEERASSSSYLFVADQAPGDTVLVIADLDGVAWVAVREDSEGEMGNILGASYASEKGKQEVVVSLLRETVAGGKYHVLLYEDNGDRDFNHRLDKALFESAVQFFALSAETE